MKFECSVEMGGKLGICGVHSHSKAVNSFKKLFLCSGKSSAADGMADGINGCP